MNRIKKLVCISTAVLLFSQSLLASVPVFANEEQTMDTELVEEIEPVEEQEIEESILEVDSPSLTIEETEEMFSVFEGMSKVSYGYTDENGNKVTVQEQSNEFSRATLDISEYTPYTFHTSLNGYWAEGQMPVLKMDGEVVFCIEPGVTAHEGSGYNPMDLEINQKEKIQDIGNFGYPTEKTHEMYYTTQGYIWELMGASFTTSYAGYNVMKNQIDTNITKYYTRPSFDGQKVTVKMGEPVTITDTNNVLSEYVKDVSTGGVKTSINGNKLTLTVDENTNDNAIVKMWKLHQIFTSVAYIKEGSQTVAKFENDDSVPFTLNVEAIKLGNAEFQKLSEVSDLPMAGVTYRVEESGKAPYEMKTDANGLLVFNDRIHSTTIDVTEIDNTQASTGSHSAPTLELPEFYRGKLELPLPDNQNYAGNMYPFGQCTWGAYNRMAQIGQPIEWFSGDGGNGGSWGQSARDKGYTVVRGIPSVGWAVSFQGGIAGAVAPYGHIAVVEYVNEDGSILVSETNVIDMGSGTRSWRVLDKATVQQLDFIQGKG